MKALLDDRARANEVRYTAEQNAGVDGDERPALHGSVRAATAQREALARRKNQVTNIECQKGPAQLEG